MKCIFCCVSCHANVWQPTVFTSLMYQSSQHRRADRCQDLLYTLNTQHDRSHTTPQERAASPDRSGSAALHPTQPSALSSYLPRNNWDMRASRENFQHQQMQSLQNIFPPKYLLNDMSFKVLPEALKICVFSMTS